MSSVSKKDKKNKKNVDKKKRRYRIEITAVCENCHQKKDECIRFKKRLICPDCLNPECDIEIPLYRNSAFVNSENLRPLQCKDIWFNKLVSE